MTHDQGCTCGDLPTPLPDHIVADHVSHPALHSLFCAHEKIPVSAPEYESSGYCIPTSWVPLACIAEQALAEFTIAELDIFSSADMSDDEFFLLMNRTPSTMVAGLVIAAYTNGWEMPHD